MPEFNYIINGVLMRYEANSDLIVFLRKNSSLIVQTFNRSGTRNLKILKHALNDFQKIFETTKSYLWRKIFKKKNDRSSLYCFNDGSRR